MKTIFRVSVAALLLTTFAACSTSSGPAAGESPETAIVIEATNSIDGVPQEYEYIRQHYPQWRVKRQEVVHDSGKTYDLLEIVSPDGSSKAVYFDISAWYGKPLE